MINSTIATKLRELRGSRTQEEVANGIGVSRSAYQMYENAERIPRDDIKKQIASYFNVTVGQLFFDE